MGGRGAGFGGGKRGAKKQVVKKPAYFKETEKAVQLMLTIEDYTLDREISRTVWVPKSQLAEDGRPGEWITNQKANEFYQSGRALEHAATWTDAKGNEFKSSQTAKEREDAAKRTERFEAAKANYNQLIAEAKAMGIKGIRVGMKRKTIEQKIREAQKKR